MQHCLVRRQCRRVQLNIDLISSWKWEILALSWQEGKENGLEREEAEFQTEGVITERPCQGQVPILELDFQERMGFSQPGYDRFSTETSHEIT